MTSPTRGSRANQLSDLLPEGLRPTAQRLYHRVTGPRWGNLRRQVPFSENYGMNRGTPIERVYIEGFLERHRHDVRGHVLEVGDPRYARRFGGDQVSAIDIVDIVEDNPVATLVADLGVPDSLPAARYDCFILTGTIGYVEDLYVGVRNAGRCLRPGGVLFIAGPAGGRTDPNERHRFTPHGLRTVLERCFPDAEVTVEGFGNLLCSVAQLMGIAAEELKPEEVTPYDPDFPMISCGRVQLPGAEDAEPS
jgi:SAM-dependent methyltransferase